MALHDPLAHQTLSAPELQALCDAHARALYRLRQDKRDLLCAIGLGFGLGLAGVGTTVLWSVEVGLGVSMTACGLNAGTLLLAWYRCGTDEPCTQKGITRCKKPCGL